jgi:hypothetical protein
VGALLKGPAVVGDKGKLGKRMSRELLRKPVAQRHHQLSSRRTVDGVERSNEGRIGNAGPTWFR